MLTWAIGGQTADPASWAMVQGADSERQAGSPDRRHKNPRSGAKTTAICRYLAATGVRSTRQIAEALGESAASTSSRLYELERQGRVHRFGKMGRNCTWNVATP